MNLSRQIFVKSSVFDGSKCISFLRLSGTVMRRYATSKIAILDNTHLCIGQSPFIRQVRSRGIFNAASHDINRQILSLANRAESLKCESSRLIFSAAGCSEILNCKGSRSIFSVASRSEILKCESSKELLSVASRKTLDWNFDPSDLVCIFNRLVDIVYKEVRNSQENKWLHEDNCRAFKQLTRIETVEKEVWSRIEGVEIEQLLDSIQSYIDQLESESLSALYNSVTLLGIPPDNPTIVSLFLRLFDKNTSFSWICFRHILPICSSFNQPYIFMSQFLMPKFVRLINSGGLEGKNRQMILSLMKFIYVTRDIISPEVFSKCIKKTSSYILEDEIFQDWEVINSVLKCMAVLNVRNHNLITDDLFHTIREISLKTTQSIHQHIKDIPISEYTRILKDFHALHNSILAETVSRLYDCPFFDDMIEICLKQLEKDDLSIIDLSYIATPVILIRNSNYYEARLKCLKMIADNLKHAGSSTVIEILDAFCHFNFYSTTKICKIDEMEFREKIESQLVRNIHFICGKHHYSKELLVFSRYLFQNKSAFVDSETKSLLLKSVITFFHEQFNITRNIVILGSMIICFSDLSNLSSSVSNRILNAIPRAEPSALTYLMNAFQRVYLVEGGDSSFFKLYEKHHEKVVQRYKSWLAEKPSLPRLVLTMNDMYFFRVRKLRSDEENLAYFQSMLPSLASNVKMSDFYFCIRRMEINFFNIYNELFLDTITDFCVRNITDLTSYSLITVISYMARVGYSVKNEEFDWLSKDLIDRKFDDLPIQSQIWAVLNMCELQIYPEKQIMKIFSLEYLQNVDRYLQETEHAETRKQAKKIKIYLSTLNSNLVIDCPHLNIPWIMGTTMTAIECDNAWRSHSYHRFQDQVDDVLFDVSQNIYGEDVMGDYFYRKNVDLEYGYKGSKLNNTTKERSWRNEKMASPSVEGLRFLKFWDLDETTECQFVLIDDLISFLRANKSENDSHKTIKKENIVRELQSHTNGIREENGKKYTTIASVYRYIFRNYDSFKICKTVADHIVSLTYLDKSESSGTITDTSTLQLYKNLVSSELFESLPVDQYRPSSLPTYTVSEYEKFQEFRDNNNWSKILLFEDQFQKYSGVTDKTSFDNILKKKWEFYNVCISMKKYGSICNKMASLVSQRNMKRKYAQEILNSITINSSGVVHRPEVIEKTITDYYKVYSNHDLSGNIAALGCTRQCDHIHGIHLYVSLNNEDLTALGDFATLAVSVVQKEHYLNVSEVVFLTSGVIMKTENGNIKRFELKDNMQTLIRNDKVLNVYKIKDQEKMDHPTDVLLNGNLCYQCFKNIEHFADDTLGIDDFNLLHEWYYNVPLPIQEYFTEAFICKQTLKKHEPEDTDFSKGKVSALFCVWEGLLNILSRFYAGVIQDLNTDELLVNYHNITTVFNVTSQTGISQSLRTGNRRLKQKADSDVCYYNTYLKAYPITYKKYGEEIACQHLVNLQNCHVVLMMDNLVHLSTKSDPLPGESRTTQVCTLPLTIKGVPLDSSYVSDWHHPTCDQSIDCECLIPNTLRKEDLDSILLSFTQEEQLASKKFKVHSDWGVMSLWKEVFELNRSDNVSVSTTDGSHSLVHLLDKSMESMKILDNDTAPADDARFNTPESSNHHFDTSLSYTENDNVEVLTSSESNIKELLDNIETLAAENTDTISDVTTVFGKRIPPPILTRHPPPASGKDDDIMVLKNVLDEMLVKINLQPGHKILFGPDFKIAQNVFKLMEQSTKYQTILPEFPVLHLRKSKITNLISAYKSSGLIHILQYMKDEETEKDWSKLLSIDNIEKATRNIWRLSTALQLAFLTKFYEHLSLPEKDKFLSSITPNVTADEMHLKWGSKYDDFIIKSCQSNATFCMHFEMKEHCNEIIAIAVAERLGAFVVYLDKTGNLLLYDIGKKTKDQSVQRVVFLLHDKDIYCFDSKKLLGGMERKIRHLQILGYKVAEIPYYEWNSMYLTTPESKRKYISEKLFL